MRITDTMKYAASVANIDATSVSLDRANQIATTGREINAPSDDPAGWSAMSELESRGAIMTARSAAAKTAAGDLGIAESSLASGADLLVQAKSIALSMATGTVSAGDRAAAASQVDSIRAQLLALANTKGATGYLFGGNQTQAPPFDSTGKFVGDAGVRTVEISEGKTAQANASGADAFTAQGGRDVFGDLAQLSADLSSNNVAGITGAIDSMSADNEQLIRARVSAGSLSGTLDAAASAMDSLVATLQTSSSNIGDADMTTAYSNLVAAQQSYQAALTVSQRLLAMSSLASRG